MQAILNVWEEDLLQNGEENIFKLLLEKSILENFFVSIHAHTKNLDGLIKSFESQLAL